MSDTTHAQLTFKKKNGNKNNEKTVSLKMIEYVGMSKPKKYVNKLGISNSRNKIKQTTSI